MIHGEVVGELWSTVKVSSLDGRKLLVVRPEGSDVHVPDVVAVDLVSAGVGDHVVVALGKAARNALGKEDAACEAVIVGVVDEAGTGGHASAAERGSSPGGSEKKKTKKKTTRKKKKSDAKSGSAAGETMSLPGFDDADAMWADEEES